MARLLKYALLGLVLLVVFMASALLAMRFAIHGRETKVPRLTGLTPVDAERAANADGLIISIENRFYSADVPAGRVASQMPAAGTTVRKGWRIMLSQSLGPQHAAIPDLIGQSQLAAGINLRRRGLEVGSIATIHVPGATPQTVVAQSPPPDAKVVSSPRVNLVMAAPDNVPQYVMPSFVDKPLAEAAAALEQAGLTLGGRWGAIARASRNQSSGPKAVLTGVVVKQYPLAGQKVTPGTEVDFEVKQ